MPFVDVLCVNEVEALILLDRVGQSVGDWIAVARALVEKYRVGSVMITLGGKGACAWSPEGGWKIPGYKVKLCDESGAGDAFLAVTVQNLVWGKTLREAMKYANKYCAWLVEKPGSIASYMKLEEMAEVLKRFQ
jgi:ribokinase